MAIKEFLKHQKKKELQRKINDTLSVRLNREDIKILAAAKRKYKHFAKETW